jgi:hypothetical protein
MKAITGICLSLLLSTSAFAAHEDLIIAKDKRVLVTACGKSNATNSEVKLVCVGHLASSNDSQIMLVANKSNKQTLYKLIYADPTGFSDQEMGHLEYKYTLKRLDKDLNVTVGTSHGKLTRSWQYSEGFDLYEGKTPDAEAFSAYVDDEPMTR